MKHRLGEETVANIGSPINTNEIEGGTGNYSG